MVLNLLNLDLLQYFCTFCFPLNSSLEPWSEPRLEVVTESTPITGAVIPLTLLVMDCESETLFELASLASLPSWESYADLVGISAFVSTLVRPYLWKFSMTFMQIVKFEHFQ